MKFFKILFPLFIIALLTACGSGTSRELNSNAYGNFQASTTLASSYPLSVLQSGVESYGYCFGVDSDGLAVVNNPLIALSGGAGICTNNKAYVESTSQDNLFGQPALDTFVASNTAGVTSVNMYKITYNTPGQAQSLSTGTAAPNETVSGLVIVPNTTQTIKGVVLYYHGTMFSKTGVPSNPLSDEGAYTEWLLASVYASQGYVVIAPDYVGQGVDAGVMHPYVLYATTNALSGLNMLTATKQFLATESITMPSNLYISSYSEGGAYAVWASRLLQGQYANILTTNNLTLKRTVGISGAYDLSGSMIPYAYAQNSNTYDSSINTYNASPGIYESSPYYLSDVANGWLVPAIIPESLPFNGVQQTIANFSMAGSKAALATYAFTAFINYNYNQAGYSVFFPNSNFRNLTSCMNAVAYLNFLDPQVVIGACPITTSLSNLFMNPSYNSSDIANSIIGSAMASTGYFTGGESNINNITESVYAGGMTADSVGTLTTAGAINYNGFAQPVLTDPSIMQYIYPADTWRFTTNSPLSLVYMNYDSTVTNLDSINACSSAGVKGLSPTNVTCLNVDNTQLYSAQIIPIPIGGSTVNVNIPLLLDHGQAEFILNMVALHQFEQTP